MRRYFGLMLALGLFAAGCESDPGQPSVDSQSHWLEACQSDADCGSSRCLCGVCTLPCEEASACSSLGQGAVCSPGTEPNTERLCQAAAQAPAGICLPGCQQDEDCLAVGPELACVVGQCLPQDLTSPDLPDMGPDMDPDVDPDMDPDAGDLDPPDIGEEGPVACDLPEPSEALELGGAPVDHLQPALAWAGGDWAATWIDGQQGSAEVVLARVTPAGQVQSAWRLTSWPASASDPSVAVDPAQGRALVAWVSPQGDHSQIHTSLRSLETGAPLSQGWALGDAPGSPEESFQAVAPVALWMGDGWAVAWQQQRSLCCPTRSSPLRMARLDEQGALLGDPVDLTPAEGSVRDPALSLAAGGLAVAWVDEVLGSVHFQLMDAQGAPLSEAVAVSSPEANAGRLSLAWNGVSGQGARYALAWEDRRQDAQAPVLYLAQLDSAGAVLDGERATTDVGKTSAWPSLSWTGQQWLLHWADQVAVRQPPSLFSRTFTAQALEPGQSVLLASMVNQSLGLASTWAQGQAGLLWSSLGPAEAARDSRQIFFLTLDEQGQAAAPEAELTPALPLQIEALRLEPRGDAVAAIWRERRDADPESQGSLFFLSTSGELEPGQLPQRVTSPGQSAPGGFALAASPEGYGVLWSDQTQSQVHLTRLSAQGQSLGQGTSLNSGQLSALALSWDEAAQAWDMLWWDAQAGALSHQRATLEGLLTGDAARLSQQAPLEAPALARSGQQLLVAWRQSDGQVVVAALNEQRQLLGSVTHAEQGEGALALAAGEQGPLLAWTQGEQVWAQRLDAQGEALEEPVALDVPGVAASGQRGSLWAIPRAEGGWSVAWRGGGAAVAVVTLDAQGEVLERGLGQLSSAQDSVWPGQEGLWALPPGSLALQRLALVCP